jgi:cytochrome P450
MFYFLYTFDRRWKEAYTKVHAYIDNHIKRVLKQTGQDRQGSFEKTVHSDCLESSNRFILLEEMAKQIRDPLELRYQILHVFVTARDTVAILLGNTLFHLARNPHIWTDLRRIALTLDPSHLTYEVIQSLVLFRNVLFETIRVQGPSGRIVRSATRNTILPVGGGPDGRSPVFVAKGTLVAMQTWALNHDKDIWGEDTDDFKPQRWAEARSPDESNPQRWVEKRSAFEFVPFLAGPRMCPAHQQVMTQATYVLVRLVTEFASIENRDPVQEYVEWSKMLTESRNGVKIALSPASGAE